MVGSLQEMTISSNIARIEGMAAVRHRIVHDQGDAKRKFDSSSLLFAARTFPRSRPGKFLRHWDSASNPKVRWIESLANELIQMASQMV